MSAKQRYTPVRFSHLTSYAGVGAIVRDVNDRLMVVTDIRYWTNQDNEVAAESIPYVSRITKSLNIAKELKMPPRAKELENGRIDGSDLPAVLFPNYAVCKRCGLLHNNPWTKEDIYSTSTIKCEKCEGQLEQVTWCAVSKYGNLDNVPWHYICHLSSGKAKACRVDYSQNYLRITTDNNGRKVIECTRKECGARNRFEHVKISVIGKQQPWIFDKVSDLEHEDVEILEVNSPGVYLPVKEEALVIPPESRLSKGTLVDKLYSNSKLCREIEGIRQPLRKKGKIKQLATEFRCTVREVKDALQQIQEGYPFLDNIPIGNDLFEDEYKAFLTPIENIQDDEDFVTDIKTENWVGLKSGLSGELSSIGKLVDNLIAVKRLRKIQIFKGFYRISQEKDTLVSPDIIGESEWLPAIELFGEGIFFTISENLLSDWEDLESVRTRADELDVRYKSSEVNLYNESPIVQSNLPRFLLLHTLSHLIIRELESTAGYPAASLKERIYCSKKRKMSGILVYTAVADIVGSLGGIIENAEVKPFLSLLDSVFKHAQWCSLDPVCTEHEGQGPGWLNRAACHACALVPEPSCDFNNVFLDRVFIKGSEELKIPNLLDFIERRG